MLSVILTILKIIGITLAVLIGLVLLIVLLVGFVPVRYRADAKYPAEGELSEEVISRRKRDALMNKVRASDEEGSGEIYGEQKKEIPVKANVVVSWLLHFVHVSASFDSSGLIINARLLGLFSLYSNDPKYVKKKEEKRKKKEEKEKAKAEKQKKKDQDKKKDDEEDDEIKSLTDGEAKELSVSETKEESEKKDTEKKDSESKESEKKDTEKKDSESKESEKKDSDKKDSDKKDSSETGNEDEDEDEDDSWWFDDEEDESETGEPESKGILGKIKSIPKKIKEKLKAIREKFKNINQKLKKLNKKKNYILDMKDDERVINGVNYGKKKLFLIIKRVLPKKLKGRVAFGMDDPATTGYITGAASLFFPIWGPHFDFEPDFENKKLEADVDLKGRIILAMLVIPAVKVWFNKDIKYIRKKIRGFKKL